MERVLDTAHPFLTPIVGTMSKKTDACGGVKIIDSQGKRLSNEGTVCCGVSDDNWQDVPGGLKISVDTRKCALKGRVSRE